MGNHEYIISEAFFFNDKENEKIRDLVSGTGIDLDQPCSSRMPNLTDIKQVLNDMGLTITEQIYGDGTVDLAAIKNEEELLWLAFTDYIDETTTINMFEVGRGSDPSLAVNFTKLLAVTHGNFLYCCDSGMRSFITPGKDSELFLKELSITKN